jgi:soluble lytic murein transglycosylase
MTGKAQTSFREFWASWYSGATPGSTMRGKLPILAAALLIAAAAIGSLDYYTSRYDALIGRVAERYSINFFLVKAMIYEESWFRSGIRGPAGEAGLMQITKAAAFDFSTNKEIPPIQDEQLFDPELNLEIGCWYLRQSLEHYRNSPHPTLFALLRYNAGESRADQWLRLAMNSRPPDGISPEKHYLSVVNFPKTRVYVSHILRRSRTHNFWF